VKKACQTAHAGASRPTGGKTSAAARTWLEICLPPRASPSTSADAVAHRDLSYSWDRGGQVVSDRANRDSPQPQLLRRGGQTKRPSADGRDREGGPLSVFLPSAAGGPSREANRNDPRASSSKQPLLNPPTTIEHEELVSADEMKKPFQRNYWRF
jgi:hypothetical protein